MDKKTSPPTRLDAIYAQIEDKADFYARNISGYILDGDELGAKNNPQKHSYDRIKRYYKAGASPYGEKLAAAEDLIEKMANEMLAISNGCATPQFKAIKAMADYNAYVDSNKTTNDDTVNG